MKTYQLLFLFLLVACNPVKNLKVTFLPSKKYDVIAWYDKKHNKIGAVGFPYILTVENVNSTKKEEINYHQYLYKNSSKGAFALIYEKKLDNSLKKLNTAAKRKINPKEIKSFIIYSKHLIEDSQEINSSFKNINFSIDSVPLSSYKIFKSKLPQLTEKLLLGDTLLLKFTDFTKKTLKSKIVKLPVKI